MNTKENAHISSSLDVETVITELREMSAQMPEPAHGYGCELDGEALTEACLYCGQVPGPDALTRAADLLTSQRQRITELEIELRTKDQVRS